MDWYRSLLADLPHGQAVWADAAERFPGNAGLADRYAAVAFEGQYLRARDALSALVDSLRREDAARSATQTLLATGIDPDEPLPFTVPPQPDEPFYVDEDDEEETHDTGNPVGDVDLPDLADLHVRPLSEVDPEATDIGHTPNVGADATRHDLRGSGQ